MGFEGQAHDFHVDFGSGPKIFIWVLEVDLGPLEATTSKNMYVGPTLEPTTTTVGLAKMNKEHLILV